MSQRHPYERKEDAGKMGRFNAWWDRYGRVILWPMLISAGIYVKEHYLEPVATIPALHAADSASLKQRTDFAYRLDGHDLMFQILIKMQCRELDGKKDPELVDLCKEIPTVTPEQVERIMETRPSIRRIK